MLHTKEVVRASFRSRREISLFLAFPLGCVIVPSPQHHEADGEDLLEEGYQSVQPEQLLAFQPLCFIMWLYIPVLSCIYDNDEKIS